MIQAFCRCALFLLLLSILSGCIYREPPPEEIRLLDLLPESRSSLDYFSYDLNSPLLFPYLTELGTSMFNTNIATQFQDFSATIPIPGYFPKAIALEAVCRGREPCRSDIHLQLNGKDLGLMVVKSSTRRKVFNVQTQLWDPIINTIRIKSSQPGASVEITNMWLLPDSNLDHSVLEPGNRFTGYILVHADNLWHEGIYLPADSQIAFPVQVPSPSAFLSGDIKTYSRGAGQLDISLVTARAFGTDPKMALSVPVEENRWIQLEWNLSDRAGRYAILTLTNTGSTPLIISEPLVQTLSKQIYRV